MEGIEMTTLNLYELVNSFHYFNDAVSFVTTNNSYDRESRISFAEIKDNEETFKNHYVASFSVTHMSENAICILVKEGN